MRSAPFRHTAVQSLHHGPIENFWLCSADVVKILLSDQLRSDEDLLERLDSSLESLYVDGLVCFTAKNKLSDHVGDEFVLHMRVLCVDVFKRA